MSVIAKFGSMGITGGSVDDGTSFGVRTVYTLLDGVLCRSRKVTVILILYSVSGFRLRRSNSN